MSPNDKALTDLANDIANLSRGSNLVQLPLPPTRRDTALATTPRTKITTMPTTTTDPIVLAQRKHILTHTRQGVPMDQVPHLSSEQLLSKYGENTNSPLGRIRQTLNSTFEGEALSVATQAVDDYAAHPQLYAKNSLSVADLVQSCLYDLNAGVELPDSARTKIDAEQGAIAVLRRVGL